MSCSLAALRGCLARAAASGSSGARFPGASASAACCRRSRAPEQRRRSSVSVAAAALDVDVSTDAPPPSSPSSTFRVSLSDVSPSASQLGAPALPSLKPPRLRLDTFLASRLAVASSTTNSPSASSASASTSTAASRARVAAAVRSGLVTVNGAVKTRPSEPLRLGDSVSLLSGALPPPPPLNAVPEPQPDGAPPLFAVAYEDDDVVVVDKRAGVVVHPGARHQSGTLVNVLLHHCGVRAREGFDGEGEGAVDDGDDEGDGDLDDDDDASKEQKRYSTPPSLLTGSGTRPGIVHRIDKGTTGLLVVAKTPEAHASLSRQFRERTVRRRYLSICVGVPRKPSGVVETNIDRGVKERTRMEAFPFQGKRGRPAVSHFRVVEVLAGGGCSLVEWRLRTGRTHQIRVHARHVGCPLLGDDAYGGGVGSGAAVAALAASAKGDGGSGVAAGRRAAGGALPRAARNAAAELVGSLDRPALHARSLGFRHPRTGEEVDFEAEMPEDLVSVVGKLRAW